MSFLQPNLMIAAALVVSGCSIGGPAYRGPDRGPDAANRWAAFAPVPGSDERSVDYSGLDELLERIVLNTGRSIRVRMRRPNPQLGTRIVRRSTSPLRSEGNKVAFSRLDEGTKEFVLKYADALARVGDEMDMTTMSRNEQLAYWYNLHNILVISQIVKNYPLRKPSEITAGPNGELLHDAPLVTIKGVALSLRDIRLNIVQRHWSDPRVMYGFFHGDQASPNILPRAWKARYISRDLSTNATEFVNALRGVDRNRDRMLVSPIYREAKDTLFPRWPEDFVEHLNEFAEEPVAAIIREHDAIYFSRYHGRTADLFGGDQYNPTSRIHSATALFPQPTFVSGAEVPIARPAGGLAASMTEFRQKWDIMWRRGDREAHVEIIDQPSKTQAERGVEVE